jgi:hypothetical protein
VRWWSSLQLSCCLKATRSGSEKVIHIHECACQEGENEQLPSLGERRSDQKRHKAMYARIDQCPEGASEEGTALDQVVSDEEECVSIYARECTTCLRQN